MDISACIICQGDINAISSNGDGTKIRLTGANGINNKSIQLGQEPFAKDGDCVHKACRQAFLKKTAPTQSSTSDSTQANSSTRSTSSFDFVSCCLFCGNAIAEWESRKKLVTTS